MASSPCRCCFAVSEHRYEHSILIAAPAERVVRFFMDGEAWYRLNPEWEVLSLERLGDEQRLKVRYERSEQEVEYCRHANADFQATGGRVTFAGNPARVIGLTCTPMGNHTRVDYREDFPEAIETARLAELNLWLDAAAGYLAYAARTDRRARLAHWLLDRFWLRMSPMSRRISLMIVGMEFLALLLFIAIVVIYRFTR